MARFEQLLAWQEARKLVRIVHQTTQGPGFRGRGSLVNQIRRAAESVTSNLAEGHARASEADTTRLWSFAIASVAEVQSQLYNALDTGCLSSDNFREAYDQAEIVSRLARALYRSRLPDRAPPSH